MISKINAAIPSNSCKFCHSSRIKVCFTSATSYSNFQIQKCNNCQAAWTYPFPDDEIQSIHNRIHYYGEGTNKFYPFLQRLRDRFASIRAKRCISHASSSSNRLKVLDIGCAEGHLLKAFLKYGCHCYGVEHPSYPEERNLLKDNILYRYGRLEEIDFGDISFDIIILWHVLEHMDNPEAVIKKVSALLNPRGIFVLAVPNFACPEAVAFKESWFGLDVPWHKYHFNEKILYDLLKNEGFQIIQSSTFCFEQSIYGLVQSILNKMGWPKNEMYEAMKGRINPGRSFYLSTQIFIALLLFPLWPVPYLISREGKGSVINLILKKKRIYKSI